jgi:ABC-2 type transport system permease protein
MALRSVAIPSRPTGLRQHARIVRVIAAAEFKLKYSGSVLGYVWSVVKPLGLFAMLYIVFGRFFKLKDFPHYPLYLLLGIVLWTYFIDTTSIAMPSLVHRSSLISKLAFPRVIVPLSVSTTTGMTLGVNLLAVSVFVAANRVSPRVTWLLLPPLLLELFVVSLGVGLFLSALFVRLRDIGQVWELILQLMFYASPIIYPVAFLPPWWKPIAFLSPVVQIIQDARWALVPSPAITTAPAVFGTPFGELVPLAVGALVVVGGYAFFRQQAPWFAERI